LDDATDAEYKQQLDSIIPLRALIAKYQPDVAPEDIYFMKEFVLWGLVEYNKLSKDRIVKGYQFNDLYGSYIRKL
jgi:magnesium chelatase subunit I